MSEIIQNKADDNQLSGLKGHSEKEKREILLEIDQIAEQNRLVVTDELFKITPLKKGGTLPLVINILGIIAIVISFYFTTRYFQEQEQTMAIEQSSYETTEGSVIKELKRQAEEKLNKKKEEISKIQNELSKLERESTNLRDNMDSQIREKELELRLEMETAMAEEKERLQNQGISTTELERQMEEFQRLRKSTFASEIAEFKSKSEAAIKEKENELAKSKQIARDILQQANLDKAELTKQLNAEKEALTRESTEVTQKLKELRKLQKNEQLIQDQLTGSYNSIIESINAGNYTAAQRNIDNVRNLLNNPTVIRLPAISKKINVEIFFLDILEKEIQQAEVITTTDFTSLTRAAEVLLSARKSAGDGIDAEAEGNQNEAKRFYNEALSTLPQISKAIENLNAIEMRDRTGKSREYLLLANKAADSREINEAIKQYRAAAVSTARNNMNTSLTTAMNGIERVLNQDMEDQATSNKKELQALEADKEKTITDLNSKLSAREEAINTLSSSVKELKNSNIDLESENRNLEQRVSEIDTKGKELKDNIETLTSIVEDSNKTIGKLNQKTEESAKMIDFLTEEINKSAYAIDALTKKAASAVNRAELLEEELIDAVDHIAELTN